MFYQLARHNCNIPSRSDVIYRGVIEPVRILKVCILHTKSFCSLVHSGNKNSLTSGNMLGKSYRCVIGRCYHNAFYKVFDSHLLAFLQEYL